MRRLAGLERICAATAAWKSRITELILAVSSGSRTLRSVASQLGKTQDVVDELARRPDAIANLAVVPAGRRVSDHAHDNAYLQLHVLGGFQDDGDGGKTLIDGPAAVFFPAGSGHRFDVGAAGLATVVVEFEPRRIKQLLGDASPTSLRYWVGGRIGARANGLAQRWLSRPEDPSLFNLTVRFLAAALATPAGQRQPPAWLKKVEAQLALEEPGKGLDTLASDVGLTGPWLARAYRHWRGEGMGDYRRRRRVEAAALLLEGGASGLAEIALECGFSDQSHMTRAFKRHLGRTPAAVRAASLGLSSRRQPALGGCD